MLSNYWISPSFELYCQINISIWNPRNYLLEAQRKNSSKEEPHQLRTTTEKQMKNRKIESRQIFIRGANVNVRSDKGRWR